MTRREGGWRSKRASRIPTAGRGADTAREQHALRGAGRARGAQRRRGEMMATWQSKLTGGYTVENFAYLTHEFAKERSKQRMRDAGRCCTACC